MEHECTEAYRRETCHGCGETFWVCPRCDRYGEVRYCGDEGCRSWAGRRSCTTRGGVTGIRRRVRSSTAMRSVIAVVVGPAGGVVARG